MTESTRERMARALYEHVWAEGLPWDEMRACGDPQIRDGVTSTVYATVDAILDVLAEPSRGMVDVGAAMDRELEWDHSERAVPQVWRAMIAAIREGK